MLTLSRIFLHNWHRFDHHLIDVEDSLYLAGHNGSGKSSILDAIQLVLIADLGQVRFNSSAQERSQRSLDSYVRGKIGEGRMLRPGATVGYLALEFRDTAGGAGFVAGVCIEAAEGKSPERLYFLIPGALDMSWLIVDGRPLSRRDLKQRIKGLAAARPYEQQQEYRADLLNRLGGLNERFFDLFLRALTFQPIRNIREFVEQWLLEERSLDIAVLQRVVERLRALRQSAQEVEEKLKALQIIVDRQGEIRRVRERYAEHTVLLARLHVLATDRQLAQLDQAQGRAAEEQATAEHDLAEAEVVLRNIGAELDEIIGQLKAADVVRRRDQLTGELTSATRRPHRPRGALGRAAPAGAG